MPNIKSHLLTLVSTIVVLGCSSAPPSPPKQDRPNFVVKDIKGDVLGMSLKDYRHKHPSVDCSTTGKDDTCEDNDTYARFYAVRTAQFFEKRLYSIRYRIEVDDDLLPELEKKYGGNHKEIGSYSLQWDNQQTTIEYTKFDKAMKITFSDNALAAKHSAQQSA